MPIVDPFKKKIVDPFAEQQPQKPPAEFNRENMFVPPGTESLQLSPKDYRPTTAPERLFKTAKTFPGSVYNVGKEMLGGMYNMATTPLPGEESLPQGANLMSLYRLPVNLASSVGQMALGGVEKLIPGEQAHEQYINPELQRLKETYGGREGFTRAMTTDPARPIMDVAGLLYGGEAALGGASAAAKTAGLTRTGAALGRVGEEVGAITSAPVRAFKSTPQSGEMLKAAFKKNVSENIRPAISPTLKGKKTAATLDRYDAKAAEAVENIVNNKSNLSFIDDMGETVSGRLPENVRELAESISQTKKDIYAQMNARSAATGDAGLMVPTDGAVRALREFAGDPKIQASPGNAATQANRLADKLESVGRLSPADMEDYIAARNNELMAFYKNPTPEGARGAASTALATNRLRKSLDDTITSATGPGYQSLRDRYSALKTIEDDTVRKAHKIAAAKSGAVSQLINAYTVGEAVGSAIASSGAGLARAGAMQGFRLLHRYLTNPNRKIKTMFKRADKIISNPNYPKPIAPSAPERLALPAPEYPTGPTMESGPAIELGGPQVARTIETQYDDLRTGGGVPYGVPKPNPKAPLLEQYDELLSRKNQYRPGSSQYEDLAEQIYDIRLKMAQEDILRSMEE